MRQTALPSETHTNTYKHAHTHTHWYTDDAGTGQTSKKTQKSIRNTQVTRTQKHTGICVFRHGPLWVTIHGMIIIDNIIITIFMIN